MPSSASITDPRAPARDDDRPPAPCPGRPGGRPRHADAIPTAQGAPPRVRPPDARVRARCRAAGHRRSVRWWSSRPPRQVREVFGDEADFALQDEPRGTADAVRAALRGLPADVAEIVVLNGDVPLIQPEDIDELIQGAAADERGDGPASRSMPSSRTGLAAWCATRTRSRAWWRRRTPRPRSWS